MAGNAGLHSTGRVLWAWALATPMLLVLGAVALWPLARTVAFSLTNATLFDLGDYQLIGLGNYLGFENGHWYGVLTDPLWHRALLNTLVFAALSVSLETGLGVGIAVLLNCRFPGRTIVRAAVLVPWAIPTVVSAKMWGWMLNDQFGIINDALMRLGMIGAPVAWLAEPNLAMVSIVLVDVWKTTPFVALLVLAALQTVPRDCYEAARIDGVSPIQMFWRITLPLIRPALAVAVIFRLLDAMRIFDLVYVMTGTTDATMTLSVFARREMVGFQDIGYGSAASTMLFLVIAAITVAYLALNRRHLTESAR